MTGDDLAGVRHALARDGYAHLLRAEDRLLERLAAVMGITDRKWQVLEPKRSDDARPHSLSGAYGLQRFPWHTDGAVASNPPRYMILRAITPSDSPTELLDVSRRPELVDPLRRTVLRAQRTGRGRYLRAATPVLGTVRYRWDPRACAPVIRRDVLSAAIATARPDVAITWSSGAALIVDNWRFLHRRGAVSESEVGIRRLERLYIYSARR